jgi:hypothetical protein
VLDREIPHALIPFRVALGPDIPDLLRSLGPNRSAWAGAADGDRSAVKFIRARMEETR